MAHNERDEGDRVELPTGESPWELDLVRRWAPRVTVDGRSSKAVACNETSSKETMAASLATGASAERRSGAVSAPFDIDSFAARYGGVTRITFAAGAIIYDQGARADFLYHVEQGQIRLNAVSPEHKERIIALLGSGDFFGESCLIVDMTRVATANCVTDCVLVRIEAGSVIRAVHEDARFAEFYLTNIVSRIDRWSDRIISQLFDSSEQRLARILLMMANYGRDGQKGTVIINNVGQETLAQMVGTTRARVSYFMNKFRKLGYIEYDGHIAVHGSLLSAILK